MGCYQFNNEDYAILTKWHRPKNFETLAVRRTRLPTGIAFTPKEFMEYKEMMVILKDMNN